MCRKYGTFHDKVDINNILKAASWKKSFYWFVIEKEYICRELFYWGKGLWVEKCPLFNKKRCNSYAS